MPGVGHYPFYTGQQFPPSSIPWYDDLGGAPFDTTQLAWDFLKTASIVPPPSPPSSPPSANKYCKKLKRLQKWKKQENKWEKKCSA